MSLREQIARIIDPFPFLFSDEHGKGDAARLQYDALKKADRIIAMMEARK